MQLSPTQIQEKILDLINEVNQQEDFESDEVLTPNTQLIEDLNFASLDFIRLVVAIEDQFQQKLGFQDLLMQDGDYIDDLNIQQLVSFVDKKINFRAQEEVSSQTATPSNLKTAKAKISAEKVDRFRGIINARITQLQTTIPPSSPSQKNICKNPQAIFILSPPRSGSTLLRVMLAGNSRLFAPPELHLLSYQSLAQREFALSNAANNNLLQGTIRALMQLKNCSASEAQALMEEYSKQNFTTQEFYNVLQQCLNGKVLVDKTPTYPSHIDILKRAEEGFENPLYIHLLRHPCGMIRSYEEAKLERIVPIMNETSFERSELAELTWLISQENILEFLSGVPMQRQFQLKFEELVQAPKKSINDLCHFLGIEPEDEMLEPYKEKSQRMTDGVAQVSEMSGDLKFHLHKGIDPTAANAWRQYYKTDFLSQKTCETAQKLGYELNALG